MKKYGIIPLPEDFEKGACERCPFAYEDWEMDELGSYFCVFHYRYNDCKLEVKEFVPVADIVNDVFGQMRDATEQEQKSVSKFVSLISKPTGANFYDEV